MSLFLTLAARGSAVLLQGEGGGTSEPPEAPKGGEGLKKGLECPPPLNFPSSGAAGTHFPRGPWEGGVRVRVTELVYQIGFTTPF